MGLMDSAVNGMAGRLMAAGFSHSEAFCLGQAAYIKEAKRHPQVPRAQLSRQDATWEISHALEQLAAFPMGPEAHRARIRLWEKVFGFGSWHEPIDPAEIYSPMELLAHGYRQPAAPVAAPPVVAAQQPAPAPPPSAGGAGGDADDPRAGSMANLSPTGRTRRLVAGAMRYFEHGPLDEETVFYVPATCFEGSLNSTKGWSGMMLFASEVCGFFQESDCTVADLQDGTPVIYPHEEIETCEFWFPPGLGTSLKQEGVDIWPSPDGNVYLKLHGVEYDLGETYMLECSKWSDEELSEAVMLFINIIAPFLSTFSVR